MPESPFDNYLTSLASSDQDLPEIWKQLLTTLAFTPEDVSTLRAGFECCKLETETYTGDPQTVRLLQKSVMSQFSKLPYGRLIQKNALQMVRDILQYLLSMGCTLEERDPLGRTFFILAALACDTEHMDYLSLLIQHRADVEAKDFTGCGALHLVLNRFNFDDTGYALTSPRYSKCDEDKLVFLLKVGCDPTALNLEGQEPIDYIYHNLALVQIWIKALSRVRHTRGFNTARHKLTMRGIWSQPFLHRPINYAPKLTPLPQLSTVPGLFSAHPTALWYQLSSGR